MANVERSQNGNGQNVIEILALYLAGRIEKEDLGENNQTVLDFYSGLMSDDPEFAARVNSRKNQLMTGRKIPLYSPDQIQKLTKNKRHIKGKINSTFQPRLWQDEPISNNEAVGFTNTIDPEKKLFQLGRDLDNRFYSHKVTPITEEIKHKRLELRNIIGLPIPRGNNPHINDNYYQKLVRKVCKFDMFGIFREYDRVLDKVPEELDLKIKQVGGLIDRLLNKGLNEPQRFKEFNQFVQEYQDRWKFLDNTYLLLRK